jgi:hypothetical protein
MMDELTKADVSDAALSAMLQAEMPSFSVLDPEAKVMYFVADLLDEGRGEGSTQRSSEESHRTREAVHARTPALRPHYLHRISTSGPSMLA